MIHAFLYSDLSHGQQKRPPDFLTTLLSRWRPKPDLNPAKRGMQAPVVVPHGGMSWTPAYPANSAHKKMASPTGFEPVLPA
jgi:hypothetical protein